MNLILQTSERTLVSLSKDELFGVANALNEVCNGIDIPDTEFRTRLGVDRSLLIELHQRLIAKPEESVCKYERVDVWPEPASVMVRAVSVYGGPVEMSTSEAEALIEQLRQSIAAAS